MATTIEPELEARLRQRAESAGISVETWLERVATDDEDAVAVIAKLGALAMEGSIVADEPYWAEKRCQLIERHSNSGPM